MKKLRIILPLIFIIFTLAMPSAFASYTDSMVFDYDDSLTDSEEATVNDAIEEAASKYEMNVCIVITDDIGGKSAMNYADDFYDDLFGIDTDGVLLLINNDTKTDWISTSGSAIKKYDDHDIQQMFDNVTPKLKGNDYKGASLAFVDSLEYSHVSNNNGASGTYNWFSAIGISLLISAVIAIIICLFIVSRYKLHKSISATNYVCIDE